MFSVCPMKQECHLNSADIDIPSSQEIFEIVSQPSLNASDLYIPTIAQNTVVGTVAPNTAHLETLKQTQLHIPLLPLAATINHKTVMHKLHAVRIPYISAPHSEPLLDGADSDGDANEEGEEGVEEEYESVTGNLFKALTNRSGANNPDKSINNRSDNNYYDEDSLSDLPEICSPIFTEKSWQPYNASHTFLFPPPKDAVENCLLTLENLIKPK